MRSAIAAIAQIVFSTAPAWGQSYSIPQFKDPQLEDGYFIRYYSDGTGMVGLGPDISSPGWRFSCEIDAMTDRQKCSFHDTEGALFVYFGDGVAPESICAFQHNFPGRKAMIRVDKNPPLETSEDGCVSPAVSLIQLAKGERAVVRRFTFPRDYPVDDVVSLAGFAKAVNVVKRIQAGTLTPNM